MSITLSVDDQLVIDRLNELARRIDDMSPAFSEIGMELENRVRARFESQSDPDGDPWAAWKPSTVLSYPEDGSGRVLDRYGEMLRNITHTHDDTSATVGFGDPYATFHEYGTRFMARRGLLFSDPDAGTLGEGDQQAVLDILTSFLQDALP